MQNDLVGELDFVACTVVFQQVVDRKRKNEKKPEQIDQQIDDRRADRVESLGQLEQIMLVHVQLTRYAGQIERALVLVEHHGDHRQHGVQQAEQKGEALGDHESVVIVLELL